jgi:PEP-CTERM motif
MKRILLLLVVAGMVLAPAAHATIMKTETQTITFSGKTDFVSAKKQLQLFDTSLGTLVSFTISASYGFTSNVTLNNAGQSPSSGTVNTKSVAAFTSDDGAINRVLINLIDKLTKATAGSITLRPAAFSLDGDEYEYNLATGETKADVASDASTITTGPVHDSTASDLTAFQASGGGWSNVLFNTGTGTMQGNTGGNTSSSQVTQATGEVTLYYTYDKPSTPQTDAPEPASIAMLGIGLLGTSVFRRSRR